MNAKRACLVALVITLAGVSAARAQRPSGSGPSAGTGLLPPVSPVPSAEQRPAEAPPLVPAGPPRLSDYILGTKPDCCGPLGGDGSISTELYLRWGPSFVLPGGFFGHTLETGWEVQGGGRALFFNTENDAAWTADFSISNVTNHGQHSDKSALLQILEPDPITGNPIHVPVRVTVRDLNRTFANIGLGREWYLWGPAANCPTCGEMNGGWNWRAGFDAGGRWGSAKLELHEIKHRTEVIEGAFVAVHSDLEIPCGGWIVVVGGRIEWDITWEHTLLQDTPEDLQNLNILMTLGVRY
jgi:hypothetical protein